MPVLQAFGVDVSRAQLAVARHDPPTQWTIANPDRAFPAGYVKSSTLQ
ncbi:MAG TPA: hypothetical protein VLX90_18305 [Steroidobacteraceae bacterium]|nr:hypothetical protein [Steroidobacteraceae bacterium]